MYNEISMKMKVKNINKNLYKVGRENGYYPVRFVMADNQIDAFNLYRQFYELDTGDSLVDNQISVIYIDDSILIEE